MTLTAGTTIPDVTVHIKTEDGIEAIQTADYFSNARVVMFVVPGAFTPTCSARHLPGFIEHADKLKAAGVDKIACLAVNDAHAMKAWGDASGATGKIDMIADSTALFAEALGIAVNMGPVMGYRAGRCAVIADNGVITKSFREEPGAFEVSSAEHLLSEL